MAVFHNKQYIDLLRLLIVSVKLFSETNGIDFMVMTSAEFLPEIDAVSKLVGIPLHTKLFKFTTMHESSCARLYLFNYEHINQYEKILYLDTDIIIQGNLATLFAEDILDKIHALPERSIAREGYGAWFYDFTKVNKNTPGMNAGILFFRNTETARTIFNAATQHITMTKAAGHPMPSCLDQPFTNYHTISRGKHDTYLMLKYATMYDDEPSPPPNGPTSIVLGHFSWPIGNAVSKLDRMKKHMMHLLSNYGAIFGGNPTELVPAAVYSWGSGTIRFEPAGVLKTTWATGTYKWLDTHVMEAGWAGCNHVLRFDDDYVRYVSVWKDDQNINCGWVKEI